jgi:hypothetical protein
LLWKDGSLKRSFAPFRWFRISDCFLYDKLVEADSKTITGVYQTFPTSCSRLRCWPRGVGVRCLVRAIATLCPRNGLHIGRTRLRRKRLEDLICAKFIKILNAFVCIRDLHSFGMPCSWRSPLALQSGHFELLWAWAAADVPPTVELIKPLTYINPHTPTYQCWKPFARG